MAIKVYCYRTITWDSPDILNLKPESQEQEQQEQDQETVKTKKVHYGLLGKKVFVRFLMMDYWLKELGHLFVI